MQKILTLETNEPDLRSSVDGLSAEDGDIIQQNKEIGLSLSLKVPFYPTPMNAIADGWKLLAPPKVINGTSSYEWWFVKD